MRLNGPNGSGNGFTILASFVIVTAMLYFAKSVLIPIALATLLSFLLAPLVARLGKWGLGKIFSIITVVVLAFSVIAVIGWLVLAQMLHLADQLPAYRDNLRSKITSLRKPHAQGVVSRTTGMLNELQKDLDSLTSAEEDKPNEAPLSDKDKPVPVEIKKPKPTPVEVISTVAGPILRPLGAAGAVIFFVVLMLFQKEDLRERFLTLISGGELNVATQAVDDATQRVSRYLVMQLIVNATYGLPIGIGLYFIGVPNAFLWGLLATLLRFIPFIGPWIAACFPVLLAFAIDPGWTKLILTLALFVVVEVFSNNLIEPWLYGASTGISNIALLVAAIFWTWLWGTAGLLLSTPLTVCLLVMGKYVPGLNFLSVLLGSEPVLDPAARFYQRMLATDEEELVGLSEKYLQDKSVVELYDGMIIPALALAEHDRHKGALAEFRQAFIFQNTRDLIDMFGETPNEEPNGGDDSQGAAAAIDVLCLPAKDDADEMAARMLTQLLRAKGIRAETLPVKTLQRERAAYIRRHIVRAVCISSIPPFAVTPARLICKRLKQDFPQLKVLVGIWNSKAQPTEIANRLSATHDGLVTRLSEAVARFETLLESAANDLPPAKNIVKGPSIRAPGKPATEPEPEEIFDTVTREAAKIVNVPVSLVSIIETDQEFWKLHGGLPPDLAGGDGLRESSVCDTNGADDILDVEDVANDPRYASDTLLQKRGIRFYAGVPLRTSDGHSVGTLCLTDTEPHPLSDRDRDQLRALAGRLMREVERRAA